MFVLYGLVSSVLVIGLAECQETQDVNPVRIRLAPLSSSRPFDGIGFLEFFHSGRWYRVCNNNWGTWDSYVACGQLGYPEIRRISRSLPRITSPFIGIGNVDCEGMESRLSECRFNNLLNGRARCESGSVILLCRSISASRSFIRLRGGALVGEGRVQVNRFGKWGSVCANRWNELSANVACRQLGFGTARSFYGSTRFGRGHGSIWYTNVTCNGRERKLTDCSFDTLHSSDYYNNYTGPGCSQFQLASVSCNVPDRGHQNSIQLLDGETAFEGRVIVRLDKSRSWASICSDRWTIREAAVVCRQLGFGFASRAIKNYNRIFTSDSRGTQMVLTRVVCRGHETTLSECEFDTQQNNRILDCGDGLRVDPVFAGVKCTVALPDLQVDVDLLEDSVKLQVEELQSLHCAASENCLSSSATPLFNSIRTLRNTTRSLLRFSLSAWNRGTADFRPWQSAESWEFHECHNHFHSMQEFSHYDLLSSETLRKAAEGHKASFCLADNVCDRFGSKRYFCGLEPSRDDQGISVGCTDIYLSTVDCQWIDITDVPLGSYVLRVSLNPLELVAESDFENNHVVCDVLLSERNAKASNCYMMNNGKGDFILSFNYAQLFGIQT